MEWKAEESDIGGTLKELSGRRYSQPRTWTAPSDVPVVGNVEIAGELDKTECDAGCHVWYDSERTSHRSKEERKKEGKRRRSRQIA